MDRYKIINKITLSIKSQYSGLIPSELQNIIKHHLLLMYGTGFDEGRKQNSHGKPVIQKLHGMEVKIHSNITDAAKKMGVHKSTISKAIINKRLCKGFEWELKNPR